MGAVGTTTAEEDDDDDDDSPYQQRKPTRQKGRTKMVALGYFDDEVRVDKTTVKSSNNGQSLGGRYVSFCLLHHSPRPLISNRFSPFPVAIAHFPISDSQFPPIPIIVDFDPILFLH